MRRFPTAPLLLGFLAAVRPAHGQLLPDQLQSRGFAVLAGPRADTAGYRSNPGGAGLGAIVGGAAGFILGGLAGSYLGGGEDLRALGDAVVGGIVGGTLGIGVGAHLGNGRRGNALASVGASLGMLLAGVLAKKHGGLPEGSAIFIPMLQIAASVIVETSVGSARVGR
jgi:hypothetical protein